VLIRPAQDGLMLHTMYFADEVRDFGEIEKGKSVKLRDGELQLATRLIDELSHDEFKPEQYQDDYRNRVLELVSAKVAGKEITTPAPETQRAQVIDLMDALKQSLAKRAGGASETPAAKTAVAAAKKPPVKASKRGAGEDKDRKAQAGRK
jgi:DNA end-binding protein Ku